LTTGLHLYAIPYSTNVERVALALGHKGLAAEVIMSDPADRSTIREASGQDLVPALDDDGFVVVDSSRIIEHLERRFPDPPRRVVINDLVCEGCGDCSASSGSR
jgi:glutathione S-transferase